MLSKCANPGCPASFSLSARGKALPPGQQCRKTLVCIPVSEVTRPLRRFEFFWLCDQCAGELTLRIQPKKRECTRCARYLELAHAASAS